MSTNVIPFPGRQRRTSRPCPSRSRRAVTAVPFSEDQMRVIARELNRAAPELLEAQGRRVPACLLSFLDWCWHIGTAEEQSR